MMESDAADCVRDMQQAKEPADRARAIRALASSRYADRQSSVYALCKVACEDDSEVVRIAAVRALRQCCDRNACPSMLAVAGASGVGVKARAASDALRSEAVLTLARLVKCDALPMEEREALGDVMSHLLVEDRSRDVRMSATKVLRWCASRPATEALVEALAQDDFGVAFEARSALMELAGKDLGLRQAVWREWLATTTFDDDKPDR